MTDRLGAYQRIFGTGPRGLALSLATLAATWAVTHFINAAPIHGYDGFGLGALLVSIAVTAAGVAWSLKSLPLSSRGRELITSGAFRHVRHPLYASFLLSFDFGLALYLDHWIYMLWALAQFPLWHANVAGEERLMHETFGKAYVVYAARTGRFVPKWRASRA
ncbi:isoprenylcysteine carboxylmethyltransferase family protein [Magnetovibrio sp.]|uniref:methyltransferase family protein n=1 Tax=Magnetovibrio sp. TaxID=2024836 RepID=UPI002F9395FC